jgi:hypothetical protein
MTLESAIMVIMVDWDKLPHDIKKSDKEIDAVCVAFSDEEEAYSVNEEWVGITREGKLVWAYASGCSCWDGEYQVKEIGREKDLKTFEFNHKNLPSVWADAIVQFVEARIPVKLEYKSPYL